LPQHRSQVLNGPFNADICGGHRCATINLVGSLIEGRGELAGVEAREGTAIEVHCGTFDTAVINLAARTGVRWSR
jgi:hypothetical protein